jgi:glycine/D-amino acid oxidase-like deaminating enzyme
VGANAPVWGEGVEAPRFAPLDGEVEADVCVVGLGGSGLAVIGELLDRGARVVGLDAGTVAGGAAGRNGGFLLAGPADFHHDSVAQLGRERAVAIYRATLREIDRMEQETPRAIRRPGSLRIASGDEEREDCARQLAAMRADGLAAEPYEGPEGDGLLIPTDGVFDPALRCRTLAARAAERGARLHEHTPAVEIARGAVRTPRGIVRADRVIVAVDGRLDVAIPELAGRVRTARLQMLATAPAPEVRFTRPCYYRWGYEYWQQLPDGRIALGGFRDHGGEGEWTCDATPGDVVQAQLEHHLRERLGVRAPVTHRWAACVGYTPTGVPVAEEVRSGVWALGGYSGTGNVVGAMLGRAVARAATGDGDDAVLALVRGAARATTAVR